MPTQTNFDPVTTALLPGINLLDASAGTGKTYAIAMLVLRFVVEQDIKIEQLLVVTFTKAATEELKDRIRRRLAEARQAISGKQTGVDNTILIWLAGLSISQDMIKQRLELALLDIDQAGIFTIHGFCQRVLNEHALESGQLFDSELTSEVNAIKQACADDFWRIQIYPRDPWETALLTARYTTPDALLSSVGGIARHTSVYPEQADLDALLCSFRQQCQVAQSQLRTLVNALKIHFEEDTFKTSYKETFDAAMQPLSAWLAGQTLQIPPAEAFSLLTTDGIKAALNGNKFRSNKTGSGDARKTEYLAMLALDCSAFDALAASFARITLVFRRALLENLRLAVEQHMQQLNVLSFDELISRLAEALEADKGALLCAELQQRFKVALIDEFQDTDQQQWFIFSRLFAVASHSLYLIGDPKQAIYKFRGADIYSYFLAQQQAQHHFTLGLNWRSHPHLVAAVNTLFQREQPFLFEQVNFTPVAPGLGVGDGYLCRDSKALPPMSIWQLAASDASTAYWTVGKAAAEIRVRVVNELLQLLDGRCTFKVQTDEHPVKPGDIAILVRSNQQAREYQNTLREAGIPAVLNSTESVFATPEAIDLYGLLQAIANPGDIGLLKQALTLSWFDLNGQQFYQMINDENALDAWIFRFQGYAQDWQNKGFMAMMLTLLTREKIRTQLSKTRLAERSLTNLQHLLELIQQAALEEHLGSHKTLDWLRTAIIKAEQEKGSGDEQQLRLESDAEAVNIVTMHRSKGLEYPIVFCPYLWQRNDYLNTEDSLIQCHENGQMIADLGSKDFNRRRLQALQEELAEELRVLYVAVTRAKYRCYVMWAEVRSKEKPNNSALAYLLEFADTDFSEQQRLLTALSASQPDVFEYQLVANANSIAGHYRRGLGGDALVAKQRKRNLYTSWQMSSYTALSALSLKDAPELPEDKVGELARQELDSFKDTGAIGAAGGELVEDELPKGAQWGNVIHELLEHLSFKRLAAQADISLRRDAACQRYGIKLLEPDKIDHLLLNIVQTPLSKGDLGFCLKNLPDTDCLKEVPFYLALQPLDVSRINQILEDCPAYQALTAKQMCGYLTGFVDLICVYQGRYYVMDYKTNSLPDYQLHTLTTAMREHNYGLQYWLYSVVLHQYLQQRLPDYDFARHFGGIRYLFVRGMLPDVAMSGVYEDLPDLLRLEQLAGLFEGR
ncbi:MAG: exodeoxyribonuclease V subunit beta [Methylococcales bacterium]